VPRQQRGSMMPGQKTSLPVEEVSIAPFGARCDGIAIRRLPPAKNYRPFGTKTAPITAALSFAVILFSQISKITACRPLTAGT